MMVLPGAALYLLVEKRPKLLEAVLSSLVLSPVLTGLVAVLLLVLGQPVQNVLYVLVSMAAVVAAAAVSLDRAALGGVEVSGRRLLVLAGITAVFCLLTGYMPFTSEWWRVRSDAWFHIAVVEQIGDYGLPPEDPYFYGMPLQYMWVYHVLVMVLSRGMNITAGFVMALLNVQGLTGFITATFLLSWAFRKSYVHGLLSLFTAILGLNALFWVFEPIKLARVFTGDVTGMAELSRLVVLRPFDTYNVRKFLYIWYNQVFFLDKFIVMTPFSLGLAFMASLWYGTVKRFSENRPFLVVLVFLVSAGMFAYHTVVGVIMLASLGSALVFILLRFRRQDAAAARTAVVLLTAMVAGAVVLAPYLYQVMHGKESEQLLPVGLSFNRTVGIIISCALGLLLAAFQVKKLRADRTAPARFFIVAAVFVFAYCLLIVLPGPNIIDKPPFFVFYPLSVAGGWTLAAWLRGKKTRTIVLAGVLLLPVNVLAFVGYFNTHPKVMVTKWEQEAAGWVKENTNRDAVFLDGMNHDFLAVAGPRRLYFGRDAYASMWGYDGREMERRKRARDNLYSDEPLEDDTFTTLSRIKPDVYVIVREDQVSAQNLLKFEQAPRRFVLEFSGGPIRVYKLVKNPAANQPE